MGSKGARILVLESVFCALGSFCLAGQRRARVRLLLEVAISVNVGSRILLVELPEVLKAWVDWSQVTGRPRGIGFVPIVQVISYLCTWFSGQLSWCRDLGFLLGVASVSRSHSCVRVLTLRLLLLVGATPTPPLRLQLQRGEHGCRACHAHLPGRVRA